MHRGAEVPMVPSAGAGESLAGPEVPLKHPRQKNAWLGVELRARDGGDAGVLVVRVLRGSPAEKAGLAPGDLLLSFDGRGLLGPSEVTDRVREKGIGEDLSVGLERGGRTVLKRVRLEAMPHSEDVARLALIGKRAPEISGVVAFQGDITSLRDARGEVVLLEFWASYCGVCRVMAPVLEEWHREYRPLGLRVVGVTVDTPSLGAQVASRLGLSYPLVSDSSLEVTRTYRANQIPMVVAIDRKGVIREVMVGLSETRLRETRELVVELIGEHL